MADYDPNQMPHAEAIHTLREGLKSGEIPEKYAPAIERCREAFGKMLEGALDSIDPDKRAGRYRPPTDTEANS